MLEISGASLRRGGRQLLEHFTLQLPDPGMYLISGPCASGKSLIARMLAGRLRPDRGKVTLDNAPLYPERGLGLLRGLSGGREGSVGPLFYAQAGQELDGAERLYNYLDTELWRAGAPSSTLLPYIEILEALIPGARTRRLDSLSFSELQLTQLALGAAVPAGVVVLDGQLGCLDAGCLPVARRLLAAASNEERYVVLTTPADFGEVGRTTRIKLIGELPVAVAERAVDT
ncbi:MAG: hypothetical protein M3R04_00145 [bacterium]|nr:hypothetical protein [bacterium]